MRILVAHLVGSQRSGGMSRLMGRAHDELGRAGHQVSYLSADDVPQAARGRGGRLLFPWLVRRAVVAATRRGEPYDIVNVHEPHGAAVAALRRGQNGTAVVAMTHGVEQRGWELGLANAAMRPSFKTRCVYPVSSLWQSRIALQRADHVICLNVQDREFLRHRFGINPRDITRVVPGADDVFGDAGTKRVYGMPRRVLFAGTWIPRKGTHILAAAFERLIASGVELHLDVLGAGVPESRVRASFPEAIRERVHAMSAASDGETATAMGTADVFVLPSLFEGTPLTLIEAMWSGLPVVTTATAGMQDVVRHNVTGVLVPPGDVEALTAAMSDLAKDPQRCRDLGRAAHAAAVGRYTWAQTAASFESAYLAAKARHG
jgi:glycosyltransferase involved in cell wall biosynthesis